MANLAHERNRLQPAETLFDPLSLSLAEGVARVPRGASVNRTAPASRQVLRHMRCNTQIATLLHKPERVEAFVSADRHRLRAGELLQHHQRCVAFCRSVG